MEAPSNSKYILSEEDSNLPNSSVLGAAYGLLLQTNDGSSVVSIEGPLLDFLNINTNGLIVRKDDATFVTRILTAPDGDINIQQNYALGEIPKITVLDFETIQPIYVTNNNIEPTNSYSKINFVDGPNCNLSKIASAASIFNLKIDATEASEITSVTIDSPINFDTQILDMEGAIAPNKDVILRINYILGEDKQVMWQKTDDPAGVEWADRPDGVKSFNMISDTDLIGITFSPDNKPTIEGDELTVTMFAVEPELDNQVYFYDGENVVLGGDPNQIASLSFNIVPDDVFKFTPSTITSANQTATVNFEYDESTASPLQVLKAITTPPDNNITISYANAVQQIDFALAPELSNVFELTATSITPSNNSVAFGFKTSTALNDQIPFWNGTTLNWSSGGAGTINSVGMSIATNSTDVLTFTGATPITTSGTFTFGYNFATSGLNQTPPSSAIFFDGTKATWKHPANSFVTVVAAGQATFLAGTPPTITVYTGWNPSSANIYFVKATGISYPGKTSTTGILSTSIIGANPTSVNVISDNNADIGKTFSYIVYYLTPAS